MIHYSPRYSDDTHEYRHVMLPKNMLKVIPQDYFNNETGTLRILLEDEWRGLGITQSLGWVHYETHSPEPHILLSTLTTSKGSRYYNQGEYDMTTTQHLSSEELLQFLSDIEKNINDEETDFKKLILYLLQFLNIKLAAITCKEHKEKLEIVAKLVDTVELVLSNKLYLLNAPLSYHEYKLIHIPPNNASDLLCVKEFLLFEWMISFIVYHVANMSQEGLILNRLKELMFQIINLVSTKLHSFKFVKLMREILFTRLENGVSYCFENTMSHLKPEFFQTLISTCHLFCVVNDYDIANKLSLNSGNYQLKLESFGRKIWFILSQVQMQISEDDTSGQMLVYLKSLILLNQLDNIALNYSTNWSQIGLLLNRTAEVINQALEPSDCFIHSDLFQTTSMVLLKSFIFCRSKQLIQNFVANLNLLNLIERVANQSAFPEPLRNTLYCITLQIANMSKEFENSIKHLKLQLQLQAKKRFSYKDPELDDLMFKLYKEDTELNDTKALRFVIREDLEYHEINDLDDKVNYVEWIQHVRMLTKKYPEELEVDITMHTLMTALSKFPMLSLTPNHAAVVTTAAAADTGADASARSCLNCSFVDAATLVDHDLFGSIDRHRPVVKSTTESLILDEVIRDFFFARIESLKNNPILACNFLIMLFNYYAVYTPEFNEGSKKNLAVLLDLLARHPNRSLRMLVTRILPLYLIRDCGEVMLDEIFKFIFQRVASIDFASKGRRHFGESTITSLILLAHVCTGERLCAIYFKLINWLGEPNDQHQNYVYCGFLDIAQAKNLSPYKLLSPYFPSIADIIIKKPLLLGRFLQTLGMTKVYFLNRTKDYTVPKLLEYHKDPTLLKQIAEASNMSIQKLLAHNLPRILASYLVRDPSNERYVVKVLSSVCPHYKQVSSDEIFTRIGDITWHILLDIQADESGNIKNLKNVIAALEIVAKNALSEKKQNANKGKLASLLIEEQMLLLVQKFSDVTHLLRGAKPYLERRKSFQAVLYLIRNHSDALPSALGQLSTCLQATLEEPDLHVLTLKCWSELVRRLPSTHLISLIDIIISLIFRKFQGFDQDAQNIAIEILQRIYTEIKDKYNRYSLYYLSLPFLDYMSDFTFIKEFRNMKSPSRLTIFQEFNRRLCTSNRYVVEQALFDLFNYCQKYQENCQREYFKDTALSSAITTLVRTIFDTATHFRNKNPRISSECAKVLAVIGALDANKFQFNTVQRSIIVQQNFESEGENVLFLVDLIENYVLKLFWASTDPHKQLFSAYAMQSFLSIMNLNESCTRKENEVWNRFGDVAKATLTPLLSSKYAASKPKPSTLKFPLFDAGMRYDTWLAELTSYLLKRGCHYEKNEIPNARQKIFQTCAILIHKDQDIALCQHLLKYVVLSHILSPNQEVEKEVLVEFSSIMQSNLIFASEDKKVQLRLCFQTIFSVFDYLNEWLSSTRHHVSYQVSSDAKDSDIWLGKIAIVERFINSFNKGHIAVNSVACDSYERTIMYIEKCYRDNEISSSTSFKLGDLDAARTLQNMYANLNDYDTLNGVLKIFSSNNLRDKLASFEYSDNSSLAYESFKALGFDDEKFGVDYNTKFLRALSGRGVYDEVLTTLLEKTEDREVHQIPLDWSLVGLQSAVYSGNMNKIKNWLEVTDSTGRPLDTESSVNYELAKCLLFLSAKDRKGFEESVKKIYNSVGTSIVSSVSSSFSKNVQLMNKLHTIYDIEEILQTQGSSDIWKIRLTNVDQDFDTQMKILNTHIVANEILGLNDAVSEMLLHASKLARESGRLDMSTKAIVRAMALNNPFANVEYAKLLWTEGKQSEAIKSISETLSSSSSSSSSSNGSSSGQLIDEKTKAKVQLQYANWLDESNHVSAHQIINEYTKAFELDMEYEKSCYDIGKYYNKLKDSSCDNSGLYEHLTIRNFLRAISIGTSYIFEALPKLITVWLDFAKKPGKTKTAEKMLLQIIGDLKTSLKNIPTYAWYTAITQILSRIVHDHEPSFKILATIITNIVKDYPKHSLWYVLSHVHSTDQKRKQRVETILEVVKKSKKSSHGKLILGASDLFSKFIDIASKTVPKSSKTKKLSLSKYFGITDASRQYDELVIPVQSNLQIRLPQKESTNHVCFPKSASVTFDGFDDQVNIFFSLQMPRQITIRGSDGKPYRLMIKSDDTRKDAKVVEFTTMVNRILATSTEARKRRLSVANYSVIPLSEKIGVIEFVMDVQTMKSIIVEERRRLGKVVNERRIFMVLESAQKFIKEKKPDEDGSKLEALTEIFQSILQKNPPILHQWFVDEFSDPSSWYIARNLFTRSSAVMSIVGYLIGLGDRHCENILFFKNTGSILHIDFDCLFEKGKTLPTPEVVPFRLTSNMVDAMGICGVDGSFRKTCEVVGQLLRNNEHALMNILENLLYDPLLDWKMTKDPQRDLSKVRKKIRGLINEEEGLAMNIHGQVDVLIQEATSLERLASMYGGWSAYV
ncbi:MEC1 [Candida oxycetoniae]|uniref:Cyclin-dependent kinases regulatory subunit n=1 Tax=Candida oxycetoniae TaxID=497107 RepID=A0AAI9SUH0_9ASCO|nr:MEC1 [Candida oxycetoniae]KAI3403258.2 MEC1 [Candida oxycetoniae]